MSETGSVKFSAEHAIAALDHPAIADLTDYRNRLRDLGLIGVDENGIGFGNLSVRDGETNAFIISGSGTGASETLTADDYARVTAFDFERNWLRCEGRTMASSESLTHAVIYLAQPAAGGVIHAHDPFLWQRLVSQNRATATAAEYGTPAMAAAVRQLLAGQTLQSEGIFAMGGHREGVIAFGPDLAAAFGLLLRARTR